MQVKHGTEAGYCKSGCRCSSCRKAHTKAARRRLHRGRPGELECRICKAEGFHMLGQHLHRIHGITAEEYRARYLGAQTSTSDVRANRRSHFEDHPTPLYERKWTDKQILAALQRDTKRRGHPPRIRDWIKATKDHPSQGTVRKRFGRWNLALAAAGLPTRAPRSVPKPVAWSSDRIIASLQREARSLGRPPTYSEWCERRARRPSMGPIRAQFGTWNAAPEAAGLTPRAAIFPTKRDALGRSVAA